MRIETQRYMSTYGFVSINKLEDLADKLFGKGWEAEDDIEQIQTLCDSVKANAYVVSSINGLKYDDDIEVREVDNPHFFDHPVYEWFQNFVDFVQEYDDSVYDNACKWADKKEQGE
jgi:hypothetical protein|tara:strand:- start:16151 stop:16498 length:348 start_codon:yes stop_codon:yes gene_type:complete